MMCIRHFVSKQYTHCFDKLSPRGGGSSPNHGGVLTQHLDIFSWKIAVHSDRAIYNVPRNVHGLSFGNLDPHRLLCQGDVVLTSCEQESARM